MDYYVSRLKELGSECSVLYVEDEVGIRDEMRIFLEKFFGIEGLELYKNEAVKSYGIEYSQGFYIGKPNSATEILR